MSELKKPEDMSVDEIKQELAEFDRQYRNKPRMRKHLIREMARLRGIWRDPDVERTLKSLNVPEGLLETSMPDIAPFLDYRVG